MKKKKRNEDNFHPKLVWYKGKIYETGNRYHDLIELYEIIPSSATFFKTVKMNKVQPVDPDE